jgi:hypothetical protein
MGVTWSDDEAVDEDEMLLDNLENYEDYYDKDVNSPARKDSESVSSPVPGV